MVAYPLTETEMYLQEGGAPVSLVWRHIRVIVYP